MLGAVTPIPQSPTEARLDAVDAPSDNLVMANTNYAVRLSCPEFTSLCPATGQPDFAHIVIDYVPRHRLVESKSLKLFLASFRNHPSFHETCSVLIGNRLALALDPIWLRVSAFWFPRGGIPIDVFWDYGVFPERMKLPPIDIPTYRAR